MKQINIQEYRLNLFIPIFLGLQITMLKPRVVNEMEVVKLFLLNELHTTLILSLMALDK